jgi:transcription termination factor Rho
MTDTTSGILKLTKKGAGTLVDPERGRDTITVPANLIREHSLPEGATVTGPTKQNSGGLQLQAVEKVCGLTPEAFQERTPFRDLIAISPQERFHLAASGNTSMRLVDLVAPIGRGTRGLIVSPPKAGKTMMLEHIAKAIRDDTPETRLVILLIDERPEEVTHFRRSIPEAEVFASSNDQPLKEHVELSELLLDHIRVELECGHEVVVLMDSLTRLVRAFNLRGSRRGRGRTLSGGLEAGALQIPRRFFGLARKVEDGGSVTIISTVLVDTGSRMDQAIYEEFKGTGNSEIILDRELAQAYLFPAVDIRASGTRREEPLYDHRDYLQLIKLRRALATLPPREALMNMLDLLDRYPTNEELLEAIEG